MSRGGARVWAGRPGWRAKAEQSLSLDVRAMHRANALRDDYGGIWIWRTSGTGDSASTIRFQFSGEVLGLRYSVDGVSKSQEVCLTRTPCHIGGSRPWLICPIRGERVAVLYFRASRFGCRHCQRIAYSSQSEDATGRLWRTQRKLEAKLADGLQRPKGMHATTYDGILERIEACEDAMNMELFLAFSRWKTFS